MPINSFLYPGAKVTTGYEVDNSLRFNDDSTDRLRRTPSSASNRRTFTFSTWVKRSALGSDNRGLITATVDDGNKTMLRFTDSDQLRFVRFTSGGATNQLITNAKFRDVSAWYHIVIAVDTTNSTAGDRLRLYVNGSEITSFSTESQPTQNYDYDINNTKEHNIGYGTDNNNHLFDGYMTEVVFIDGQQLDPTSFGEFDEDTGIWKPIDVSGLTFGTNGFYLDFENSGSLGADVSGNGNNFTVNNLTSIDQSTDTCSNNFNTFMSHTTSSYTTLSDGGLVLLGNNSGDDGHSLSGFGVTNGKWYYEIKLTVLNSGYPVHGWLKTTDVEYGLQSANGASGNPTPRIYGFSASNTYNGSAGVSNVSFSQGDIIGVALDLENGALYVSQNGTFINSSDPTSGASKTNAQITWTPAGETYSLYSGSYNGSKGEFNFGSPPYSESGGNSDGNGYGNYAGSVPSGYYSLNTKNLAEFG